MLNINGYQIYGKLNNLDIKPTCNCIGWYKSSWYIYIKQWRLCHSENLYFDNIILINNKKYNIGISGKLFCLILYYDKYNNIIGNDLVLSFLKDNVDEQYYYEIEKIMFELF